MLDIAAFNSYRIQQSTLSAIQEFIEGQMINLFECKYSSILMLYNHYIIIFSVPFAVYLRQACYITSQSRPGFALELFMPEASAGTGLG
jgi:hypothetical protein